MKNKLAVVIICALFLMIFTGAAKTKKTTLTKSAKQIAELKNTISALEVRNVSLTAKVSTVEKDLKKFRQESKTYMTAAIASAGIALILLIIIIAGSLGGKNTSKKDSAGSDIKQEKIKHYEDLEYNVLNDWQNIWFHPDNIDIKLYDDLKNHFPDLYSDIEEWKTSMNSRQDLALDMARELERQYPDIETLPCIYMLSYEENHLLIEDNYIKSGTYTCAEAKEGTSPGREKMKEFYEDSIKLLSKKPYSDLKSLSSALSGLKSSIDLKIRKIKFTKELPGDCSYTS